MASIRRFEDLEAWQQARILTRSVYSLCASEHVRGDFGFADQIRRASVSVMSNIAEGSARRSDRQFAHHLDIARGSAAEVQSLLYVALDVGYLDENTFDALYTEAAGIGARIGGLRAYLRRSLEA